MGQGEVFDILEKKGTLTEKEIAELTGLTIPSVWNALNRLVKSGDVERLKKTTGNINLKCYVFQIKQEEPIFKHKSKKNGKQKV